MRRKICYLVGRLVVVLWGFGAMTCLVDDSFLEGKLCGGEAMDVCGGSFVCQQETCTDAQGVPAACKVCRKETGSASGGGSSSGGSSGGSSSGGDACVDPKPACKKIPECTEVAPTCNGTQWVCSSANFEPVEKTCDDLDNDCDGKIDSGMVCTLSGAPNTNGFADGTKTVARFFLPRSLALYNGAIAVADSSNHRIRLVQPADGSVTTLAGTGDAAFLDHTAATSAKLNFPTGVFAAKDGSLLIVDQMNNRIRKLASGAVTTLAGTGTAGSANGLATAATFNNPSAVIELARQNTTTFVVVADMVNHCLRMIDGGQVTTFAGQCQTSGFINGTSTAGTLTAVRFNRPVALTRLSDGGLLVSEEANHAIRKVTLKADGTVDEVSTLAGTGSPGAFLDGDRAAARFYLPVGALEESASGAILVTDSGNHRIRAITTTDVATRLGSGKLTPFKNGSPLEASFNYPKSLLLLADGRLVIADTNNHVLRVFNP